MKYINNYIGVYLLSNTTLVDRYIYYLLHRDQLHFQHFSLAIFRLINEKLSKQLYSTCVCCIQWGGKR